MGYNKGNALGIRTSLKDSSLKRLGQCGSNGLDLPALQAGKFHVALISQGVALVVPHKSGVI
jgi:hypothetical protein